MKSILRVVFTKTWDPIEVAGGVYTKENGARIYLHGSGVALLYDIAQSLNYILEATYANYEEGIEFVAMNISEIGGLVMTQNIELTDQGLGSSFVYLHPLEYEASCAYFRQPPSDTIKTMLTRPFTSNLWVILFSMMLMVSILFRRSTCSFKLSTVLKTIIFALELLIGRHTINFNGTHIPTSSRISRLIVSFFGIIMTSLYIAKFSSVFVMRDILVKTPEDLITYRYDLNTYSPIHVYRIFEDFHARKHVMKELRYVQHLKTFPDVIKETKNGQLQTVFAYPDGFYPQALYWQNYDKELRAVSSFKSTRKTPRSFYIRKDSVHREPLNIRILMFIERGINFRHEKVFKSRMQFNCDSQITEFQQITVRQLEVAFAILIVGALASVFRFLYSFINFYHCFGCRKALTLDSICCK